MKLPQAATFFRQSCFTAELYKVNSQSIPNIGQTVCIQMEALPVINWPCSVPRSPLQAQFLPCIWRVSLYFNNTSHSYKKAEETFKHCPFNPEWASQFVSKDISLLNRFSTTCTFSEVRAQAVLY